MAGTNGGKRPGAGRPAGSKTVNTTSPDIKELARKHAGMCIEQLVRIAQKSNSDINKLSAINQILDRGFGKPSQALVGDPDLPVEIRVSWIEPK